MQITRESERKEIFFLDSITVSVFVVILVGFDSSHYQKQIQISLMVRRALLVQIWTGWLPYENLTSLEDCCKLTLKLGEC